MDEARAFACSERKGDDFAFDAYDVFLHRACVEKRWTAVSDGVPPMIRGW